MATQSCAQLAGFPLVGLGVWKAPGDVTEKVVYEAIKLGYRHIDGACDYGNEKEVGKGIHRAISEGLVKREDLWVTSKLWNSFHRKEHVAAACQRSLDDMGLDYVDLYLIHFPIALKHVPMDKYYPPGWCNQPDNQGTMEIDDVPYSETWGAMEALKAAGKAKHIGVSNVQAQLLMDIFRYCKVRPEVLQIELHPYLNQAKLVDFAQRNGVAVTSYSPLGAKSYMALGLAKEDEDVLAEPVVTKIAAEVSRSPAQVLLRYQIERGVVVIPKSQNPARLAENLALFDFKLTADQCSAIAGLDRNRRYNDPGVYAKFWGWEGGYPIFA